LISPVPQTWQNAAIVWLLAVGFLLISIPIETLYSWQGGLLEPYYIVKLVGWALLGTGAIQMRIFHRPAGFAFLAAGWGWLAANFARAVADRMARVAAGQALRLGSIELWFASGCLAVCLIGLTYSLAQTSSKAR
jgi:hypothetical protein